MGKWGHTIDSVDVGECSDSPQDDRGSEAREELGERLVSAGGCAVAEALLLLCYRAYSLFRRRSGVGGYKQNGQYLRNT